MNETLQPLFDWCLVRVIAPGERTRGGIILPGTRAQDTLKRVEVVAIGRGPYVISGEIVESPVQVGEIVLVHKGAGHKVYEDDDDLLFIKAGDCRAVVG